MSLAERQEARGEEALRKKTQKEVRAEREARLDAWLHDVDELLDDGPATL